LQEQLQGPVVHTAKARLVAVEHPEGEAAMSGEGLEGQRQPALRVDFFKFFPNLFRLAVHLGIERGGFDLPEAALTPASRDHLHDEVGLDHSFRLELLHITIEELIELLRRFDREDEGPQGEAVAG
jgi:hypothetical protein